MAKGFFIITDISGYTEFLTKTEIEHAHEILQTLFKAQLKEIQPPFVVSSFRGDAIVMYIPESGFVEPQSVLESLENLYGAFFEALEQMQYRTTCSCRACQEISLLDLKMVTHYGDYVLQQMGDQEELLGADVIVPHRMLKNHVIEKTGVTSYALFSESAQDALQLSELVEGLEGHVETYEHLGEFKMAVYDLNTAREKKKSGDRIIVDPDEAWFGFESEIDAPPALVWDYLINLPIKADFMGFDYSKRMDEMGGRIRPESEFHCVHGDFLYESRIVDWDPFDSFTAEATDSATNLKYFETCRFIPIEGGTRFVSSVSKPEGHIPDGALETLQGLWDMAYGGLKPYIERDIAEGKVTVTSPESAAQDSKREATKLKESH